MDRASIHLRLPRDLHDDLRSNADAQGVSLNTLLVGLIAGSIGWTLDPTKRPRAVDAAGAVTTSEVPDAAAAD